MSFGDEAPRHVVVLDCNIYLDVARVVGAPFTWQRFDQIVAQQQKYPVPHPVDKAYDSLRAVALSRSGRLAAEEVLEVWTSTHIDQIVRGKAGETRLENGGGLGWSGEHAESLLSDLVWGVVKSSDGGTVGTVFPEGNPPLDHEDGRVFGACKRLSSEDPLSHVYCVTQDGGFREAFRSGKLGTHTRVLEPAQYVNLIRAARFNYSTRNLFPKS